MSKNIVFIIALLMCACLFSCGTAAADNDFDFVRFAKEKVLKDFHPTAGWK